MAAARHRQRPSAAARCRSIRARATQGLRSSKGVTGLETAIILIAFVIVAAVFAYTVLRVGIFATEQTKIAVTAGLAEVANSIEPIGGMKADGVVATVLTSADAAADWTASANVTATTETGDRKEGSASVRLTIDAVFTTGVVAYEDLPSAVDLSGHYAAGLWIKSSSSLASGVLQLLLDDDAGCIDPEESLDIEALTGGAWKQVRMSVTDASALSAVACIGLNAVSDPGAVAVQLDLVRGPAEVQRVHVALATALRTGGVTFVPQTDSDGDGLFSDEADQANLLVVWYIDSNQLVRDIAWSTKELGWGDGDATLENGETFLLTIELRAVDPVPTANTLMTFHIIPHREVSIVLEKIVPGNVTPSMLMP